MNQQSCFHTGFGALTAVLRTAALCQTSKA